MPLERFIPKSPDPFIRNSQDFEVAKFGHLNTIIEYVNTYVAADSLQLAGTGPLTSTARYITDSLGNASSLAISNGNIGIGTTTPTSKLTVFASGIHTTLGDSTASSLAYIKTIGSDFYIGSSGTSRFGFAANDAGLFMHLGINNIPLVVGTYNGTPLVFGTNNFETARFDVSGNFGIGTSSISAKLQIKGSGSTSATTSLLVQNSNASALLQVKDNGYVEITNSNNINIPFQVQQGNLKVYPNFDSGVNALTLETNAAYGNRVTFYNTGYGSTYHIGQAYYANRLAVYDNNYTELTSWDLANMRVGIGTSTPFALLTVGGQSSFYSVQSAGVGADFFYSDINPNLTAGANNQIVSLLRLRDRGQANTGGFTGTQRLSLIMENVAGGQFPFQLFSESGALRVGFSSVATPTALVHIQGQGSTAGSTSLLIQNSSATQVFKVGDDGLVQLGRTDFINWSFFSNTLSVNSYAFIGSNNGTIISTGALSGGVHGNNDGGKVSDSGIATAQVASAVLEVSSTTKGFLPPRMTTTQRTGIVLPAAGLIVYDTDTNKSYTYDGTAWQAHW